MHLPTTTVTLLPILLFSLRTFATPVPPPAYPLWLDPDQDIDANGGALPGTKRNIPPPAYPLWLDPDQDIDANGGALPGTKRDISPVLSQKGNGAAYENANGGALPGHDVTGAAWIAAVNGHPLPDGKRDVGTEGAHDVNPAADENAEGGLLPGVGASINSNPLAIGDSQGLVLPGH